MSLKTNNLMSMNYNKILREIGLWLAELAVIFLGAYLAFC